MGIGLGIVLIAVGAILTWGVTADAEGVDVNAVGVILMVVGLVAVVLSMLLFERWSPYRRRRSTYVEGADADAVVERRPVRRTTVVEDDDVAAGPPPP